MGNGVPRSAEWRARLARRSKPATLVVAVGACAALAAVAAGCGGGSGDAGAKTGTLEVAMLRDPAFAAGLYGLEKGKVTSSKVKVHITYLELPALVQAIATRRYAVATGASTAIPALKSQGVKVRVVSGLAQDQSAWRIFVPAKSKIHSVKDLKGKTMAVAAPGSAAASYMRMLLTTKYGLKVPLNGGDVKFSQIPDAQVPAALSRGAVDAAYTNYVAGWKMQQDKNFRTIATVAQEYKAMTGSLPYNAVMITTAAPSKEVNANIAEFNRMHAASLQYLKDNRQEVLGAVSSSYGVPQQYLADWFDREYVYDVSLGPEGQTGLTTLWENGKKIGLPGAVPQIGDVLCSECLTGNGG
jgi:ABC-type nitrate/sulfonate/bicarbonate transport system substrate-binding protein